MTIEAEVSLPLALRQKIWLYRLYFTSPAETNYFNILKYKFKNAKSETNLFLFSAKLPTFLNVRIWYTTVSAHHFHKSASNIASRSPQRLLQPNLHWTENFRKIHQRTLQRLKSSSLATFHFQLASRIIFIAIFNSNHCIFDGSLWIAQLHFII